MNLSDKLKAAFNQINLNLIDLKCSSEQQFQKFLNSVPDFFIERQNASASFDESQKIISNLPPNVPERNKLLFGIDSENRLIGFFEILLNFPSQEILLEEKDEIKDKLGDLGGKRFTIGFLVIHSLYRKRGLGSQILSILETNLLKAGYHYSHLIVNQSNTKAKKFYERHGYQFVKETDQLINNKVQSCFIMIKKLI